MKLKDSNPEVLSAQSDKKSRKGICSKLCIGAAVILAASAVALTVFTGDISTENSLAESEIDKQESTAQIDMYLAQAQTQTATRQTEKTTEKKTTTTAKKTTEATKQATQPSTQATTAVTTQAPVQTKAAAASKPMATVTDVKFIEYKMYTNDALNLRNGAGTGYKKIAEIPLAAEITVTGDAVNGWYPVKYGDKSGYVYGKYIQKDKPKVTKAVTTETNAALQSNDSAEMTTASTLKTEYLGTFKITAYCSCEKCCGSGATGHTASGTVATQGRTIAASSKYPFGTKFLINGTEYTVEDRGGSVSGNVIDMYFANHQDACNWGVQYCEVYRVI